MAVDQFVQYDRTPTPPHQTVIFPSQSFRMCLYFVHARNAIRYRGNVSEIKEGGSFPTSKMRMWKNEAAGTKERKKREREGGRDNDIKITARDCGEPREIEYANEEEWPPNSRQVLYYSVVIGFSASGVRGRKRKKGDSRLRPQTNFFRRTAQNLPRNPSVAL